MNFKIADKCFSHSKYSSEKYPEDFELKFVWDKCNPSENNISVVTDNYLNIASNKDKKIAWSIESETISPYAHNDEILNKYFKIFTHNKRLLDISDKYIFVPVGGCWINPSEQKIYEKNKKVSIIASNKNFTTGHKFRHNVISSLNSQIDTYGTGYKYIDNKLIGLKDYMYQIVIENSKYDFYFTEKIIDCFKTGTIPIYWGCPSIGNFFDINGIIQFNNIDELKDILNNISKSDYLKRYDSIEYNFNKSNDYLLTEKYIIENNLLNYDQY